MAGRVIEIPLRDTDDEVWLVDTLLRFPYAVRK